MGKYQIFVSYRREGGDMLAGRVADNLTQRGYRVFFDVEAMRSGEFNEQIYDAIDGCSDFIMILSTTPNALERCKNEGDWVRRELGYALKKGKNIIPVFARDYEFPEVLPDELEGIRNKQGIHASRDFFPEAMDRLVSYLKAKLPGSRRCRPQKAAREQPAPLKAEIPLPLFLKTLPSSFMGRNQHLLRIINDARSHFYEMSCDVWHMTAEQFVTRCQDQMALGEEEYHSAEYYNWVYRLCSQYHFYAPQLIEKELCSFIHDVTLRKETVERHFRRFDSVRMYVGSVYDAQKPYYQTRSAELVVLWILMDLGGRGIAKTEDAMANAQYCMSLSNLEPLVECVFQGLDFGRCVYVHMDEIRPYCKKLSDHPVLREVSFTIEQILKGADASVYDGEILSYLNTLYTCWKIHDKPYPLQKAMKRFLQINYKYLLSQGIELSDETLELFRAFLADCSEH